MLYNFNLMVLSVVIYATIFDLWLDPVMLNGHQPEYILHFGAIAISAAIAYLGLDRQGEVRKPAVGPIAKIRKRFKEAVELDGVLEADGTLKIPRRIAESPDAKIMIYFAKIQEPNYSCLSFGQRINSLLNIERHLVPINAVENGIDKKLIATFVWLSSMFYVSIVASSIYGYFHGLVEKEFFFESAFILFLSLAVMVVVSSLSYTPFGAWVEQKGEGWYAKFKKLIEQARLWEHDTMLAKAMPSIETLVAQSCPNGYETMDKVLACTDVLFVNDTRSCGLREQMCPAF